MSRENIMTTFEVAHVREQGVDLIITVVNSSFGRKSTQEQQATTDSLQQCASAAGLAGTVVPVWDAGGGRLKFWAPPQWHRFFGSISLSFVAANINRKLTCG